MQVLEFRLLEGISDINTSCSSHQKDSVEVIQTSDQESSWSPPCGSPIRGILRADPEHDHIIYLAWEDLDIAQEEFEMLLSSIYVLTLLNCLPQMI